MIDSQKLPNSVKFPNNVSVIIGSALIGYGTGSISVAIGVFCIAFALLTTD